MDNTLHARLTAWRRHLHAHPELSLQEAETARLVAEWLGELGIACVTGVGGHGVVATLRRGHSNRAVGLRADMDALAITESTGASHASTRPGVMHACGHDGHTVSLLGAAALLAADQDWSGTVQLVFQPAEEGYGGAKAMLADGLLDRFPMERIFALHNWPGLPAGEVAVHAGPVMAAGSRVRITLEGHAGHAAMPHLTRDPVLAAAQLLVALQSVVSRTTDPLSAAVLSIGVIEGGQAENQIPHRAALRGTFRAQHEAVQVAGLAQIRQITEGMAQAFGMRATVETPPGVAAVVNHPHEAALAAEAAEAAGLRVRRDVPPSMASEDFGWLLRERPGAFVWVGNGPGEDGRSLHNPGYDFNDAILPATSGWLAAVAKAALKG